MILPPPSLSLTSLQALSSFLLSLRSAGVLELDDTTDHFLRLLLELSVNHALSTQAALDQVWNLDVNSRSGNRRI